MSFRTLRFGWDLNPLLRFPGAPTDGSLFCTTALLLKPCGEESAKVRFALYQLSYSPEGLVGFEPTTSTVER